MSKRRGLPEAAHMKHDAHFVDSLSERFGPSVGRLIPIEEIETNPDQPRRGVGDAHSVERKHQSLRDVVPAAVLGGQQHVVAQMEIEKRAVRSLLFRLGKQQLEVNRIAAAIDGRQQRGRSQVAK